MLCASLGASRAYYSLLGASRAENTRGATMTMHSQCLLSEALTRGADWAREHTLHTHDVNVITATYYGALLFVAPLTSDLWAPVKRVLADVYDELEQLV
jgi:hypothetical protein